MVKRLLDIQKVPYLELEFFKLATDKKLFFLKAITKYASCKYKHNSIDNSQCPICMVWFHNDCFNMWLQTKWYRISLFLYLIKFLVSFSDDLICDFQWFL